MVRFTVSFAVIAAALALIAPAVATRTPAAEAAAYELTRQVTYQGRTLTVRLHPVKVRAPGFEVLVQQPDGSFVEAAAPVERAYLGGVDGVSGAVASGIVRTDGTVDGQVVFDRGATWRFRDGTVYETRGLTPPATYQWPSSTDATRNVSVSPRQIGGTTYRWDLGYDLSNAWFTDPGTVAGSVSKALDEVELATVSLLDVYEPNALLRTAVGRVVIRASAAQDPYQATTSYLSTVRDEWRDHQADAGVDGVALFHGSGAGGGVAFVSAAGTVNGASANGGFGAPRTVLRHELGHTWGGHDNHTNGPEGATILSGNQYERFDGTELSAIARYRETRQAATAPFTPESGFAEPVPPYAALDLVDLLTAGVPHSFRPIANDHDANRDAIALLSVTARSHAGGAVTRAGDVVTYVLPLVRTPTVDWVEYVVRDASGKTATGVSLFRVAPAAAVGPVSSWRRVALTPKVGYEVANSQSQLLAGLPARLQKPGPIVQRGPAGGRTRIVVLARGRTYKLRSAAGRGCFAVKTAPHAGRQVVHQRCRDVRAQRWRVVEHPKLGTAIVSALTGRCLMPARASMSSGARLVQARCGVAHAKSWRFVAPDVSTWPTVQPSASTSVLTQVRSGLQAGVPTGAAGASELVLRSPSGDHARFGFLADAGGTYELRSFQTEQCVDVYGSSIEPGGQVGTWSCHRGRNQRWVLLANPAGAVAVRNLNSGLCLSSAAPTDGAGLLQQPCGLDPSQRWRMS